MQTATATATLDLRVSDVSGQRTARASGVSPSSTVGELVNGLLAKMSLQRNDVAGQPLQYRARLEREGRHLHSSELVGDALETDDHIVLQPEIHAG